MKYFNKLFSLINKIYWSCISAVQLLIVQSKSQNKIENKGRLKKIKFDIVGNNNSIKIAEGTLLTDAKIYIRGDHHNLVIGDNCIISKTDFWFEDNNCEIVLGKGTTIESAHIAATEPYSKIILGDDCMLSTEIEIRTGDSHSIIDIESRNRINYAKNVILNDHIWVGARAIILKGSYIGQNSIISTGAVVTAEIPNNSIAAGIPAKVIKSGVSWKRERIYKIDN